MEDPNSDKSTMSQVRGLSYGPYWIPCSFRIRKKLTPNSTQPEDSAQRAVREIVSQFGKDLEVLNY